MVPTIPSNSWMETSTSIHYHTQRVLRHKYIIPHIAYPWNTVMILSVVDAKLNFVLIDTLEKISTYKFRYSVSCSYNMKDNWFIGIVLWCKRVTARGILRKCIFLDNYNNESTAFHALNKVYLELQLLRDWMILALQDSQPHKNTCPYSQGKLQEYRGKAGFLLVSVHHLYATCILVQDSQLPHK